ncbi:hypothetical protein Rsub_04246 [Raphidocelis subcapitata]|uniref:Uncharacterized protein n=1 Tax=Raphidocelis subcapitata TaxID=307507 RepID=A0A2V0NV47_9CHLO|nr:hypothetical protein Rsub_04246 [Raphidocelis subcapitata]|eukprot:GBF91506.1 hypothetical protein Rsub_04246 [Raphidocelis subcapitata]
MASRTYLDPALSLQQCGLIVAGALAATCWQFVAGRLAAFERDGPRALAECWMVMWLVAVAARALCWRMRMHVAAAAATAVPVAAAAVMAAAPCAAAPLKAAALVGAWPDGARSAGCDGAASDDGSSDDVAVQKRRAQAAQASSEALCRAALVAAHGRLRDALRAGASAAGADLAGAALALRALADTLLDAPHACDPLLIAGCVPDVAAAASAAAAVALGARATPGAAAAAHPALLQASWVLLVLARGPPALRLELCAAAPARALVDALSAALGPPQDDEQPAELEARDVRAAVLRNASLAALLLVADADAAGDERAALSARASSALAGAGALVQLARAAAFEGCGGVDAAVLAGGALAALAGARDPALAAAAAAALLQPGPLRGVVFVLAHGQGGPAGALAALPGAGLALAALHAAVPRLLARAPERAVRLLVEERLVGPLLSAAPRRTAQLVLAHLVSSRGQAALAAVEREWAVDVPLALAQALVLPAHLTLPAAACASAQPCGGGTAALLGGEGAGGDDVHTDVLLARLLLRGSRLGELVAALGEGCSSCDGGDGGGANADGGLPDPAAAEALLSLAGYLLARDTELSRVQLARGDSVIDSESCGSAGSSSSIGSSGGSGGGPSASLPPLPLASAGNPGDSQVHCSGTGPVVFAFGPHQHRMGSAEYKRLRRASKLLHSVALRASPGEAEPIRALRVPLLSDEENWWALRRLEAWTEAAACGGADSAAAEVARLGAREAALLWIAADFWQVDSLQMDCEDLLASALSAAAGGDAKADADAAFAPLLGSLLSLCAQHPASSARLLRLVARALLGAVGARSGLRQSEAVLIAGHRDALLPAVYEELRDRLVALCVLNMGQPDADSPDARVE